MALPIFTITIFVSAFLLFLVQPLVGKLILPKLGGTPQVWNTCMVFFQSALLLGYAYTHTVSTKLRLRQQLMVHGALLALPIVMMLIFPIYYTVQAWPSLTEGTPILNTLVLLALIVGIPFFVVSTSAPLLQKWFGYSGHSMARDPYFLYSASNAGSLLSLFFYPTLIEPIFALPMQSYIWFGGYLALGALILYCAYTIFKLAPPDEQILAAEAAAASAPAPPPTIPEAPAPAPAVESATSVKSGYAPSSASARAIQRKKGLKVPSKLDDERMAPASTVDISHAAAQADVTWWRRIRWVLLAAVPSSLMLGVTSYISTDLSPFPLIWIVPLALYLLSFILVYMKGWTGKRIQMFGGPGYTLHQMIVYVAQPLGLIALCYVVMKGGFEPYKATFLVMMGFFATALACHGELAYDRPSTKHLTEYFLLMSFGGMLGGVFNGIIAPIVFQTGVLEFYIVIIVACLIRPQYIQSGWFEELIFQAVPPFQSWVRDQGDEMAKSMGRTPPRTTYLFNYVIDVLFALFILSISYFLRTKLYERGWLFNIKKFLDLPDWSMEFVLNVCVFLPPLIFLFFFAGRPVRFGLATLALFLGTLYLPDRNDNILESRRTYFGLLRVMSGVESPRDPEEMKMFTRKPIVRSGENTPAVYEFTYLMHGTTYHGRNYKFDPADPHGVDMTRLATTYYHRFGPVGVVMERYNYFKGPQNTYWSDARMPVTMVGNLAAVLGTGTLPLSALVDTWTDPPYATIGLGTGTMASYARPYQHMTYYEIDEVIRHFSLPEDGSQGRFTYLQNAIRRGVNLEVVMGDARLSLEHGREEKNIYNSFVFTADFDKKSYDKEGHYREAPYNHNTQISSKTPNRDKYYKVINVDAFSSDAIPVHLITRQAIQLYLDKLDDDGVLCVHTSNRHMDLVRPVARIAKELGVECKVGKDRADREWFMGHFSSEYVMIYRDKSIGAFLDKVFEDHEKFYREYVETNKDVPNFDERRFRAPPGEPPIIISRVQWYDPYKDQSYRLRNGTTMNWHTKVTNADSLWTDDYSYILGVLR